MFLKHCIGYLVGVAVLFQASFAWAENYRVGINDLLSVQIAVWDEVNATIVDMSAVTGSYPVGADGNIAVPLAGLLPAADLTPAEIAQALETAMAAYVGIGQTSRVAVSVESYAPIYVTGQIEAPGVYDYAPGLTVLKAVSLAGGVAAVKPLEGEERNFLMARSAISVLQRDLMFLTAKRHRLLDEINGTYTFSEQHPDVDQEIWAAEAAILKARNARYDHELKSLTRARASLTEALAVLDDKLATNQAQLEAAKTELQREEDLVERGLAASARAFDRATYVSELESRLLDIERSILQARQELQENELNDGQLRTLRDEDNTITLQEVETKMAEVEAQLVGQYDLMSAAAGRHLDDLSRSETLAENVSYAITRARGGAATLRGDASTAVMPGDVIEVIIEHPDIVSPSN
ncbi:MAG: polysaccharide biosynthesis/export family protein [Pseudomonadota bacterium]